jgi:predicted nucleotidyltransferase
METTELTEISKRHDIRIQEWRESLNGVVAEIALKIRDYYGGRLVSFVIFGSVAKNLATPSSDIDILIVLDEKEQGSFETFMEYFKNVEEKLQSLKEAKEKGIYMVISPVFKTRQTLDMHAPWLWQGEFIVIYDKDDFFKGFETRLKKFEKEKLIHHKSPMPYYKVKD